LTRYLENADLACLFNCSWPLIIHSDGLPEDEGDATREEEGYRERVSFITLQTRPAAGDTSGACRHTAARNRGSLEQQISANCAWVGRTCRKADMGLLEEIRAKIEAGEFEFSRHVVDQTIVRRISVHEIREAFASSEVIEDYPEGKHGPTCLIFGPDCRRKTSAYPMQLPFPATD
jgi:hypothetical protein